MITSLTKLFWMNIECVFRTTGPLWPQRFFPPSGGPNAWIRPGHLEILIHSFTENASFPRQERCGWIRPPVRVLGIVLYSSIWMFCRSPSFHMLPTFGQDTIRQFSSNVSELKKLAVRDFEDLLQASFLVFCAWRLLWHWCYIFSVLFLYSMDSFPSPTIKLFFGCSFSLLTGTHWQSFVCIPI